MKRLLRFAFIGTLGLVLVVVILGVLATFVIKPNDYKPQLIAAVKHATGRDLLLPGDLKLAFFPSLSVQAGQAELQNAQAFGTEPFIRVDSIQAQLALAPLFKGSVEITEVSVKGVRCNLIVDKNGKANWDMKPAQTPGPASLPSQPKQGTKTSQKMPAISIDELSLKDIHISYKNLATGDNLAAVIDNLTLDKLGLEIQSTLHFAGSYTDAVSKQIMRITLDGTFTISKDLIRSPIPFAFKGKLDTTTLAIDGSIALAMTNGFPAPDVKGNIRIGDLNVDAYLPPQRASSAQTGTQTPAKPAAQQTAKAPDLSALRNMKLDLTIMADSVTVSKVPLRTVKAHIQGDKGIIAIAPFSLRVANGTLDATAKLDANKNIPVVSTAGSLKNLRVERLLQDMGQKKSLSGEADVQWNVTGTGIAWPELSRSLQGTAAAFFRNGVLPGFQIVPQGVPGLAPIRQDVAIERFSADWRITKGIASTNNLDLRATGLSATGNGTFSIPTNMVNYNVAISLPALPIILARITGPAHAPSYTMDVEEFLKNTVKGTLQLPGKATDGTEKLLNKGIKEIFGGARKKNTKNIKKIR